MRSRPRFRAFASGILLLAGGAGLLTAASLGLSVSDAGAAPQPCTPVDAAHLTGALSPDGTAVFTITDADPTCDPITIGVAAYLKQGAGLTFPQQLVDSATGTIDHGSVTLHVTPPAEATEPWCDTQLDAFTGPVLPEITETQRYGPRLLDYRWGTVPSCVEAEGTSTTSTTSTTTSTSSTTSTTTSTTSPSSTTTTSVLPSSTVATSMPTTTAGPPGTGTGVKGESIVASPGALASPAAVVSARNTLPKTGPQVATDPMITAAGVLFLLGGAALAWSNRPGQVDLRNR